MTNPVSFVTSTVPAPDDGKGVNPETGSSDSVSGVEVHEGAATGVVVVVDAGVVVAMVVEVLGANVDVVVVAVVVVVVAIVVDGDDVVVDTAVVVGAGVVVVGGRVVVVVVEGAVVVGVTVHEIAIDPAWSPQPV